MNHSGEKHPVMFCHSVIHSTHVCSIFSFDLETFMMALGAIHEIEVINTAGFLPGVHLGYLMCDTCSHASRALQSVEHMLSIHHSPNSTCNYMDFRPMVKIFLGGLHSEVAITVSTLLNAYMVPLVSDNIFRFKIVIYILLITLPEETSALSY